MLKNVTLSAEENLISQARENARKEHTTLNAMFRQWLARYVRQKQTAMDYGSLMPLCEVFPCIAYYSKALEISERGYALYDAMIITAGLDAGCETLYTEDLQHGQTIQELTIINLFRPES